VTGDGIAGAVLPYPTLGPYSKEVITTPSFCGLTEPLSVAPVPEMAVAAMVVTIGARENS